MNAVVDREDGGRISIRRDGTRWVPVDNLFTIWKKRKKYNLRDTDYFFYFIYSFFTEMGMMHCGWFLDAMSFAVHSVDECVATGDGVGRLGKSHLSIL